MLAVSLSCWESEVLDLVGDPVKTLAQGCDTLRFRTLGHGATINIRDGRGHTEDGRWIPTGLVLILSSFMGYFLVL